MILIPHGTIFHAAEHFTKPKALHILWLFYYLFDEYMLYYDQETYQAIKSL